MLLFEGFRGGLVVDEGEGGLDGALKRLLVHLHQRSLALAMDRVSDKELLLRKGISRHEGMFFSSSLCV